MTKYLTIGLSLIAVSILIKLRLRTQWPSKKLLLLLFLSLFVSTIIFDNYLTGLPIVMYNDSLISGVKLGTIPIEDFSYIVALVIIIPSFYEYFNEKK